MQRHTDDPLSPTRQAFRQLVKGCQIAMHNAVLLAGQNEKLEAENKRQKRKRSQRRLYLARGGVLTGVRAQQLILIEENQTVRTNIEVSGQERQRAPPRCSMCFSLDHNARRCSDNQTIA